MYMFVFQFYYKDSKAENGMVEISADDIDEAIIILKQKINEGLDIENWDFWRVINT